MFQYSLLKLLIKRDLALRTTGTLLGRIWLVLQPVLQITAFWFLFDVVLKVRVPLAGKSYLSYFLIGMLPWLMFMDTLTRSTQVLVEFSDFYRRNAFPIALLPLLPALVSFLLYAPIYMVLVFLFEGIHSALLSVIIVAGLMLLLLPICYILAVLGVFVRDVRQATPVLLTFMMYLTPIFYTPQALPPALQDWLWINPMADAMAVLHGVLQHLTWSGWHLARPFGLTLLLIYPAYWLFKRALPHIREYL